MYDTVERTVYYYEVKFKLFKDAETANRNYIEIIDKIKELCDLKTGERFIKRKPQDENKFGVYEYYDFKTQGKLIAFKLIRMRKDVFPQLMNDELDNLEDLTDADNKSVVESTHVILDYSDPKLLKIGIEYNTEGPRISDMLLYLRELGKELKIVRSLVPFVISNDKLEEVANKIGDCKFLNIKVLRENIEKVKLHDNELGSVLESLSKFTQSNYFNVNLRLDFEHNNPKNKSIIMKFIKLFSDKKENLDMYESFKIEATDTTKDTKTFESFDLLMDKIKSRIIVDRKQSSKVIISKQMYKLMLEEYLNEIA